MTKEAEDRVASANVLALLVRDRCATDGTTRTSRTGLQASVPVNERPGVRRGLDALLDAGVLAAQGENIALTPVGKAFTTKPIAAMGASDPTPGWDSALAALRGDERLTPYRSVEHMQTLPARLETYRAATGKGRVSKGLMVLGALATAAAAFAILR